MTRAMLKKSFLILGSAVFALSACSSAKEQLGLTKSAPDEFAVVKRAPLEMPPDYSLRPPRPGAPRPQEQSTSDAARAAVLGSETAAARDASDGEGILLQRAGAAQADPTIRQKVDEDAVKYREYNKPVAQKLLGIGGDADAASASVVDAKQEAERLRKNAEEGKPVTEGETPYIEE